MTATLPYKNISTEHSVISSWPVTCFLWSMVTAQFFRSTTALSLGINKSQKYISWHLWFMGCDFICSWRKKEKKKTHTHKSSLVLNRFNSDTWVSHICPWRCKWQITVQCWYLPTKPRGVTSQKTIILTLYGVCGWLMIMITCLYDLLRCDCTASNERTVVDDESCKECGSNSLWPVLQHYLTKTLMYWVAPQQI